MESLRCDEGMPVGVPIRLDVRGDWHAWSKLALGVGRDAPEIHGALCHGVEHLLERIHRAEARVVAADDLVEALKLVPADGQQHLAVRRGVQSSIFPLDDVRRELREHVARLSVEVAVGHDHQPLDIRHQPVKKGPDIGVGVTGRVIETENRQPIRRIDINRFVFVLRHTFLLDSHAIPTRRRHVRHLSTLASRPVRQSFGFEMTRFSATCLRCLP